MKPFIILFFFLISATNIIAQDQQKAYEDSFTLLNSMLKGERTYSFKKAVFSVENAYFNGHIDTVFVNREIQILTSLCHSLVENRFLAYLENDRKDVNKWAATYQVLCDSIPLVINDKEYKYIPFQYDFEDVFGSKDIANMFVSKLLYSRKGNCHSLPYLYKILFEKKGKYAHLAHAPRPGYINHKKKKNDWTKT